MRAGTHALVDEEDALVAPDVEGPARRERLIRIHDAVAARDLTARVAQNRKIHGQGLREVLVGLWRIDAGGKVCDVEDANVIAALTERLALGGSTGSERLREPPQHNPSPAQILAQRVGLAVGGLKGEIRRLIADLEFGGLCGGRAGDERARDERERQQSQHLSHMPPRSDTITQSGLGAGRWGLAVIIAA